MLLYTLKYFRNQKHHLLAIMAIRLWSFQTGETKLERFLPKNQHTQKKLLNLEFWINGKLSISAKI
jgi:uncharacterized membrane protein YwzB